MQSAENIALLFTINDKYCIINEFRQSCGKNTESDTYMDNKLEKKYGLFTAICMVAGCVIGSGVFFKATAVLKNNSGNMVNSLLTVAAVGLLMMICTYTFSILAQKYEKVNGIVDYAEASCGKTFAYFCGWFIAMIYYPVISSTLAWISANYTLQLTGECPILGTYTRLFLVVVFLISNYLLNIYAPKVAGKFQVSTTVIKLIPLFIMAIGGTIIGLINGQTAETLTTPATIETSGTGFLGAVVAFAFAYEGWIIATCINSEIRNSKRNLPLALVFGSIFTVAIYVVYFLGIASVLSANEIISADDALPQTAFTALFGGNKIFGTIAYVFIIISCLGTMNGVMMGNCRSLYSIAVRGEGPMPEALAKLDKKSNMPIRASLITIAIVFMWMLQWEFCFWPSVTGGTPLLPEFFCFENDELPIITLYGFYIPVFMKMMIVNKDLHPVKRFVFPILSIIASLFMIYSAISAYKIQTLYYLTVFAIFMLVGVAFYRGKDGKAMYSKLISLFKK